jgi:nicotinamide mononucleotide transporter
MLDNKKLENWHVWALVNIFAIYTYFSAGLALAGFQYIFFLANTVYGYYAWKRGMQVKDEPVQPLGELVHA